MSEYIDDTPIEFDDECEQSYKISDEINLIKINLNDINCEDNNDKYFFEIKNVFFSFDSYINKVYNDDGYLISNGYDDYIISNEEDKLILDVLKINED